ncbi:hypothetical protein CHS0354_030910 [Potamilus streckersoni]|nr:hypothetical protein CHS0354_030910 [Potamilus streckersoni]
MEISVTLHNSEVAGYQESKNDKPETYTKKDIFVSSESEDYLTVSEDEYSKTRNSSIPESEVSHVFKNSTFKLAFQSSLPYEPDSESVTQSDTERESEKDTIDLNIPSSPYHISKSSAASYLQQPANQLFYSRTIDLNTSDKKLESIPTSDLDTLDTKSRQVPATDLDNIPHISVYPYIPVTNLDTLNLGKEQHKSDKGESRLEYFKEMAEEEVALPPPLEFSDGTIPNYQKMETGDLDGLHPITNLDDLLGSSTQSKFNESTFTTLSNGNAELKSRTFVNEENMADSGVFERDDNSDFDIPKMAYISEMTMTNASIEQHMLSNDKELHGFSTNGNSHDKESLQVAEGVNNGNEIVLDQFELSARPYIVQEGDISEEEMMSKESNQVLQNALNDDYLLENELDRNSSDDHGDLLFEGHDVSTVPDKVLNHQISTTATINASDTLKAKHEDSMDEQEHNGNLFGDKRPIDSNFHMGDSSIQQPALGPNVETEENEENYFQFASSSNVKQLQFKKASAVIVMENSFGQEEVKSDEISKSQTAASPIHHLQTLQKKVYLLQNNSDTKDDEMVPIRVERKVDLPEILLESVSDSHLEIMVSVKSVQDESLSQKEQTLPPKPKPKPKPTIKTFPEESSASPTPKGEEEKERPEIFEEVIEPVDVKNGKTKNLVNVIHVMNALKLGLKSKERSDLSKQQTRDSELNEIQASEEINTKRLYEENGHDIVLDNNVQDVLKEIGGKMAEPSKHLSQVSGRNGEPDSLSSHKAKSASSDAVAPVPRKVNDPDENQTIYTEDAKSELKTMETSIMQNSQDQIVAEPELVYKSPTFEPNKSSTSAKSTESSKMKYSTSIGVSQDAGKETVGPTNTPLTHIKSLAQVKPLSFSLKSLTLNRPVKYNTTVNTGAGLLEKITSLSSPLSQSSVVTPAKSEYPIKRMETMPFEISILKGILGIGIKVHVTPEGFVQVTEILPSGPVGREGNIKVGDYLLSINNTELTGLPDGKVQQILRLLPRGLSKIVASAFPPISEQTATTQKTSEEAFQKPMPSPRKPKSPSLNESSPVDALPSLHERPETKSATNSDQSVSPYTRAESPSSPRQQSSPSLPRQPPVPTRRKQTPPIQKSMYEISSGPSYSSFPMEPQHLASMNDQISPLSSLRTASEPPPSLAESREASRQRPSSKKTSLDVLDGPVTNEPNTSVNSDFPNIFEAAINSPLSPEQPQSIKCPPPVAPKPKKVISGESKESKIDRPQEIEAEIFVSVSHPSQLMQMDHSYDRKSADVLPGQVTMDYVSSPESSWTQGEVSSRKGKTEDDTNSAGTDSHNIACSQETVHKECDNKGNVEGNEATAVVNAVDAAVQKEKFGRNFVQSSDTKASENVSVVTTTALHDNIITETVSFTNHLLLSQNASESDAPITIVQEKIKSYFSGEAFQLTEPDSETDIRQKYKERNELLIDFSTSDSEQQNVESAKIANAVPEIHPLHIISHDDYNNDGTHVIIPDNNVDNSEEIFLFNNQDYKNLCPDVRLSHMNMEMPVVSQDLTPLEMPRALNFDQADSNDSSHTTEPIGTDILGFVDSDSIIQLDRSFEDDGEVRKFAEKIVSDVILNALISQPELQLSTLETMTKAELSPSVDHTARTEESLDKDNVLISFCDELHDLNDSTNIVDLTHFELCSQYHTTILEATNPHSAINELLDIYGEASDSIPTQDHKNYESTNLTNISFDAEIIKPVEQDRIITVISENNEGHFQVTNMTLDPMVTIETNIGTDTADITNASQNLLSHTEALDLEQSFPEQAENDLPPLPTSIIPQLMHDYSNNSSNCTVFNVDDSFSFKQVEKHIIQGQKCIEEFPDEAVTDVISSYANIERDLSEKQNKAKKEIEKNICPNVSITGEMTVILNPDDKEKMTELMQPKGDNSILEANADQSTNMQTKDEKSKRNGKFSDGNGNAEPASKSTRDDHQRIDVDRMIRMLSADHEDKHQGEGQILEVTMMKGVIGLGFVIEGGKQSPRGDLPLMIRKIFKGGPAEQCGLLKVKDEILSVNGEDITKMRHSDAWNHLKFLPDGEIKLVIRRYN